jgi:uncharacterized membrane protein YuzA (DUF378 family)
MKLLRFIALLLIVIGALNWGLVGFFQYDLVADLFGGMTTMAARIVYGLVGLAGLWGLGLVLGCCSGKCSPGCGCGCGKGGSCDKK